MKFMLKELCKNVCWVIIFVTHKIIVFSQDIKDIKGLYLFDKNIFIF